MARSPKKPGPRTAPLIDTRSAETGRDVIESFVKWLSTGERDRCANLFADDATLLLAQLRGAPVRLRGKDAIRAFLKRVPQGQTFRVHGHTMQRDIHVAGVEIVHAELPTVEDTWRFTFHEGRIRHLELIEE